MPHRNRNTNLFHGHTDAAFGNAVNCKSTTGYVYTIDGCMITWMLKKQSVVALSPTDAEYVLLSKVGCKACWLRSLYHELGYNQIQPTEIRCNHNGVIAMVCNLQFHKQAKHIDISLRHHRIRDQVQEGVIEIQSCQDPDRMADILTKALAHPKHKKHCKEMGLVPV